MRSTKLPALAATAAMLALAPAGALAAGGHHRLANALGHCRLTLLEAHVQITEGETENLGGQLSCHGAPPSTAQTVTVYGRSAGSGYQVLGTASTESGAYSFETPKLETDTVFYASTPEARSVQRAVRVEPVVKLEGPSEKTPLITGRNNAVIFTGSVNRKDHGARVVLQRENAVTKEEWHVIQVGGPVGENGEFTIKHRFVVPGDANIRVVVQGNRKVFVRGISNELNYNISQKENPNLTLNTSGDPIFFNQPVTLTGTVLAPGGKPAPEGQTVTLLARGRGTGYTTVATSKVDNNKGEYTFTQTPPVSTFYRVLSNGKSSAVLFEGVKYVLAALPPSKTAVKSGEEVVFSGTVNPVVAGHPVYLERENASGGGFHIVELGKVEADGTYSITDRIFGSGSEHFRIKVPGDIYNQSASSSPISIEVTPSPARAFNPAPPSKLPQEGQI
jgi:hypothetical protein